MERHVFNTCLSWKLHHRQGSPGQWEEEGRTAPGACITHLNELLRESSLGYELTSHTQAVQSAAVEIRACDWLENEIDQSDTSCSECCCHFPPELRHPFCCAPATCANPLLHLYVPTL